MKLHFKETAYNWGDTFYILDDNNRRAYYVKSSILLWNKQFQICDLEKNPLVVIKNEPKSVLKKKYYISIHGQQVAAITREISLLPKYTIEGLDWAMHGLMLHEYEMVSKGVEVLSFHSQSTPWGHRPVLEIPSPKDELLALAVVLTISYIMNAKEDASPTNHL